MKYNTGLITNHQESCSNDQSFEALDELVREKIIAAGLRMPDLVRESFKDPDTTKSLNDWLIQYLGLDRPSKHKNQPASRDAEVIEIFRGLQPKLDEDQQNFTLIGVGATALKNVS